MISDALRERHERERIAMDSTVEKQGQTQVGGSILEVDTAETVQTFSNANTLLTNTQHGWPRGTSVVAGRQLGQTPLMELVKGVIISQVTGGELAFPLDEESEDELEDFRDRLRQLIAKDHVAGMSLDDLFAAAVSDMVDTAWAYWEVLPSQNGEVPVVALKPIDALTIQHNLTDQGQFVDDEPHYWHSPTAANVAGTIQPVELSGDPTALEEEQVVAIRAPGSARPNDPYGMSPAVRAREWLEVYSNSTADINRDYDDTQIPEGIFMPGDENAAFDVDDLTSQLRQSRGDKRRAPAVPYRVDFLDVGFDTTETRITEQQWFLKMVMAMFGINRNELGMTENTGLGTETPAQATLIFKKITKPFLSAFEDAIKTQLLVQFDPYEEQFGVDIRNVDPRQEIIEQEEARKRFTQGTMTYSEMKQELGEDPPDDTTIEVGDDTVDWANQPRWLVEQRIRIELDESQSGQPQDEGSADIEGEGQGPPDFDSDPVLSIPQAASELGFEHSTDLLRRQLEDTIDVISSFIVSVAYNRTRTPFMQIEFEKSGQNAIYWYANVPENLFFRFLQASSKGEFFNEYIRHTGRNNFDYVRVQ